MKKIFLSGLALCATWGNASAQVSSPLAGIVAADANGDGVTTRAELQAYRRLQFAELDVDADGSVRAAEFGALPGVGDRAAQIFAYFDADGDGALQVEEFAGGGAPVFERLDADQNGAVDQAEIAAAMSGGP